jgi:hypothetical protein
LRVISGDHTHGKRGESVGAAFEALPTDIPTDIYTYIYIAHAWVFAYKREWAFLV